jgi:hypothetical protein
MDVVASKADLSKEPKFAEAVAKKIYALSQTSLGKGGSPLANS